MKRKLFYSLALLFLAAFVIAQVPLRSVKNEAFSTNEVLQFRVHYGFMDAGVAKLEVFPETKKIGGRSCYRIVGTGRSVGTFDWFFKVRDHYESYVDSQAMVPWMFIRRIHEGGYEQSQNVSFNHFKNTATSEKKTVSTPENVQDLISAFYFARTIDMSHVQPGDTFVIYTYLDDEVFPIMIRYAGKDIVKVKAGKFRCLVFKPSLLEGRVFKEEEGMTIWISDDKNRIPVRAEAEILVGSVKMDLTSFQGLANPAALLQDKN